jgi:uncharacterized C2H2 Zn-finger protein
MSEVFECEECGMQFNSEKALKAHIKKHAESFVTNI